ncbi:unnamed protein product [Tilletia laevis]|uniref:Uncharacterized protein n=1 Tax=Tilletia laevis TaxID=157183 RepID=A0A9N8QIP6_9BASI|nr:unnamed protein product [Tilletia laevis]
MWQFPWNAPNPDPYPPRNPEPYPPRPPPRQGWKASGRLVLTAAM